MKKLIAFAFAIIALCSCSGNGCSRSNTESIDSVKNDTTIVDTNKVDSTHNIDTAAFDMICPD